MPPKDDLMMGLDGQDRRDMREKLRREAAQKDHAAAWIFHAFSMFLHHFPWFSGGF